MLYISWVARAMTKLYWSCWPPVVLWYTCTPPTRCMPYTIWRNDAGWRVVMFAPRLDDSAWAIAPASIDMPPMSMLSAS